MIRHFRQRARFIGLVILLFSQNNSNQNTVINSSSHHLLILLSNCLFSYNGVNWDDLVLSIYDVIIMSVRDKGLSVIPVERSKYQKVGGGGGRNRLDHG